VLSDNGAAFTSRLIHPGAAPSRFAHAVNSWGSRLIHSSPYHPQTCGKVERHHQTLKKWLSTQPVPTTLRQPQRLLDTYRDYYNHHRRHSALPRRSTPHEAWTTAPSLGGPTHLPLQTDASVSRCKVENNGRIHVGKQRISIGRVHCGTTVTAIRHGYHVTIYNQEGEPIGYSDLDPSKAAVKFTSIKIN
jgi:putative transposase